MKYYAEVKCDALVPGEKLVIRTGLATQLPRADARPPIERRSPQSKDESACADYSEQAIPERDPAFRLAGGTDHEEPTVEALPAAVRRDLARRLEQLGMSHARAVAVASL